MVCDQGVRTGQESRGSIPGIWLQETDKVRGSHDPEGVQ
jgi:hypothetical protein